MAIGRHGTDLVQVFGDHLDKSLVTNHQSKMGSQLNEPERTKRPNTGYSNSGLFFFFFFRRAHPNRDWYYRRCCSPFNHLWNDACDGRALRPRSNVVSRRHLRNVRLQTDVQRVRILGVEGVLGRADALTGNNVPCPVPTINAAVVVTGQLPQNELYATSPPLV